MKQPFVKMSVLFIAVQFISYFFLIWEYSSGYDHNIANMFSSFILIPIVLTLIRKRSKYFKNIGRAELFVISSFVAWFIAEILYGLISYIPDSTTYPSSADILYVTGYGLFMAYLYQRNKVYKLETGVIVSSLVTYSLFIFYFLYLSFAIFHIFNKDDNAVIIILSFIYPILDIYIALIGLFFYFQVKRISLENEHLIWIFVAAFGFLSFTGDSLYSYKFLFDINDGLINFFNLCYNIGYSLLGIAYLIKCKHAYHFSTKYESVT